MSLVARLVEAKFFDHNAIQGSKVAASEGVYVAISPDVIHHCTGGWKSMRTPPVCLETELRVAARSGLVQLNGT